MDNSNENHLLNDHYNAIIDLWRQFCEQHSDLYKLTCDEYSVLLTGHIDNLEKVTSDKKQIIEKVKDLEIQRLNIINDLNSLNNQKKINNVSDLIFFFRKYEQGNGFDFLEKFNLLLIEIIEKIQIQNKKNQFFLNKTIKTIIEIKSNITGKKSFHLYNAQGIFESSHLK